MIRAALLLSPLLLAGCSKPIDQPTTASLDGSERQQMQASIDETTQAVRLKAAEARIVALERQVGELEATPEKIDLQLLTQRIEQLEAKVYARAPGDESVPTGGVKAGDAAPKAAPSPAATPNKFNPFGL